jgi:hypothetical protein
MTETKKHRLLKPGNPSMVEYASWLRQLLLKFRFNSYNSIRLAAIPGADELRPRSRDLLASLSAPVVRVKCFSKILLTFIKNHHDPATRESLGARQDALLAVVFELVHQPRESVRVKDLAQATNALLLREGERATLTDKAAGTIVSSLGFRNKTRTKFGWILRLDSDTQKRAHQLLETHGIAHLQTEDIQRCAESCPMCQNLVSASNS